MVSLLNTLGSVVNKVGFWSRQHAPQLMIVGGIVGGVATVALASAATLKASEDVGEAKAELAAIEETKAKSDTYTEDQVKKDRQRVHLRLVGKLAMRYAPAVGTGVASTALVLGGANILNRRNTALAVSLASSTATIKDIRDGLIKEFGEEKGKEIYNKIRYGLKDEEVKEEVIEDGKKKKVKAKLMVTDDENKPRTLSYVRKYDWHCPGWINDMTYLQFWCRSQQNHANDLLRANGYLWMDQVDGEDGFRFTNLTPEQKMAGRTVGWRIDPNDTTIDNFVDFNIQPAWEFNEDGQKVPVIYMEYNVDGSIFNKLNWNEIGKVYYAK